MINRIRKSSFNCRRCYKVSIVYSVPKHEYQRRNRHVFKQIIVNSVVYVVRANCIQQVTQI